MDATSPTNKMQDHDGLQSLFGRMAEKFSSDTTEWIKELLEVVLINACGVVVELDGLSLNAQRQEGQFEYRHDNTLEALIWLLNLSKSRAEILRDAVGFQVIMYPDLAQGGMRLTRKG